MLLVLPLGLSDGLLRPLAHGADAGARGRCGPRAAPAARRAVAVTVRPHGCGVRAWPCSPGSHCRRSGPSPVQEWSSRRGGCILYAVALLAVGAAAGGRRRAFLLALTTAVSNPRDRRDRDACDVGRARRPVLGSLLAEPVGYPNAMGVLAAMAVVLAIGLGGGAGKRAERGLRGVAPFLILVLGLTGAVAARLPSGWVSWCWSSCRGSRSAGRARVEPHRRSRSAVVSGLSPSLPAMRRPDDARPSPPRRSAPLCRRPGGAASARWRAAWRSPGPRLPPCIRPRRRRAFARRTGGPRWPRCGSDRSSGAAPAAST